jgi:hypothetical protein
MKKTLTLVLFLGLTSTLSAQFLLRTETTKVKNVSYTKNIVINLDTMPYVSFISVFSNTPTVEHGRHTGMDIGDGYSWIWIDETLLPIRARLCGHSESVDARELGVSIACLWDKSV